MFNLDFYSDGSSSNVKDKNAGWASVLLTENRKPMILYGHLETPSTNNHGELIGIIGCAYMLKMLEIQTGKKLAAVVTSDSEYAIGCLDPKSTWMPSKNQDLIQAGNLLLNSCSSIITFKWVKGHTGNKGNELADEYSRYGRLQKVRQDPNYTTKYFENRGSVLKAFSEIIKKE